MVEVKFLLVCGRTFQNLTVRKRNLWKIVGGGVGDLTAVWLRLRKSNAKRLFSLCYISDFFKIVLLINCLKRVAHYSWHWIHLSWAPTLLNGSHIPLQDLSLINVNKPSWVFLWHQETGDEINSVFLTDSVARDNMTSLPSEGAECYPVNRLTSSPSMCSEWLRRRPALLVLLTGLGEPDKHRACLLMCLDTEVIQKAPLLSS